MKKIVKYANRKLYDPEISHYISLKELLVLPLGSFQVTDRETGSDITIDTLLAAVSATDVSEVKVKIMTHCIGALSGAKLDA